MHKKKINIGLIALAVAVVCAVIFVIAASGINNSDKRSIKTVLDDLSNGIKTFELSEPIDVTRAEDDDYAAARIRSADKALERFYTENADSDALKTEFLSKEQWNRIAFSSSEIEVSFSGFTRANATLTLYYEPEDGSSYYPPAASIQAEMVKKDGQWMIDFWNVGSSGYDDFFDYLF